MATGRSQRHLREIYGRDSTGWTEGGDKPNIPSGSIVVSDSAFGGVPAGDDTTGTGTPSKPYKTLAKALTVVTEGKTIVLNGDPTAPSYYTAATFFNITKGMTIDGIWKNGANLRAAAGQTRVLNIAPTAGQTVRLGQIIIDGNNNTANCVLITDQTTKYRLEMLGTVCTGWTTQGVSSSSSAVLTKVDALLDGCMLLGVADRSAVYCKGLIEGGFIVRNSQITLSSQNLGGHGGVIVWAKATGCYFEVSQNVIYIALDGSAGTSTVYGVQAQNIPGAKVQRNNITLDGSGLAGTRPAEIIQIGATGAAPLDSSGALVTGNTLIHKVNGGMAIEIGEDNQDTGSRGFCNGALVEGNTVWCNDFSLAATTHGIFNGSGANSIIRKNIVQNAGIPLGDKEGDGARVYNNIFIDGNGSMLRLKGAKNGIYSHNTFHRTKGSSFNMCLVTNNSTNSHVGANGKVSGNIFYSDVTTNFVSAEAAEACAFDHNDYYSSAAAAANPWSWDATTYPSLGAWAAAHETSPIAVNPMFFDTVGLNYHVAPSQTPLDVVPFDTNVQFDYANVLYSNPATTGAYQRLAA